MENLLLLSNVHHRVAVRQEFKLVAGREKVLWTKNVSYVFEEDGQPLAEADPINTGPRFLTSMTLLDKREKEEPLVSLCATCYHEALLLKVDLQNGHQETEKPGLKLERYCSLTDPSDHWCYYHPAYLSMRNEHYEIWQVNGNTVIIDRHSNSLVDAVRGYYFSNNDGNYSDPSHQGSGGFFSLTFSKEGVNRNQLTVFHTLKDHATLEILKTPYWNTFCVDPKGEFFCISEKSQIKKYRVSEPNKPINSLKSIPDFGNLSDHPTLYWAKQFIIYFHLNYVGFGQDCTSNIAVLSDDLKPLGIAKNLRSRNLILNNSEHHKTPIKIGVFKRGGTFRFVIVNRVCSLMILKLCEKSSTLQVEFDRDISQRVINTCFFIGKTLYYLCDIGSEFSTESFEIKKLKLRFK